MTDPQPAASVAVVDVPQSSRYEARLAADPSTGRAVATYELRDGAIAFMHTLVPRTLQGHGVGSALARTALDDARRRGLAVIPICPFFASYIRRHAAYQDLVPEAMRAELLAAPAGETSHE